MIFAIKNSMSILPLNHKKTISPAFIIYIKKDFLTILGLLVYCKIFII